MKNYFIFLLGFYLMCSSELVAQNLFQKIYYDSLPTSSHGVLQTYDQGFVAVGDHNKDIFVIKTDQVGDTLWTRIVGTDTLDMVRGYHNIAETSDSGYIVAAETRFTGGLISGYMSIFLIRLNSSGDTLWTKAIGIDTTDELSIYSISRTLDNNYIISGEDGNWNKGCLLKIDSAGNVLWYKTFTFPYNSFGYNYAINTSDSGFLFVGTAYVTSTNTDMFVIKTNSIGDTLWTRLLNWTPGDRGCFAQEQANGKYIIAGSLSWGPPFYLLVQMDTNGNVEWSKAYGFSNLESYSNSVYQTRDGGFIISGYANDMIYNIDFFLVRTDSNGDTLWTMRYDDGNHYSDYCYSMDLCSDSGVVLSGQTGYYDGVHFTQALAIFRINKDGNSLCYSRSTGCEVFSLPITFHYNIDTGSRNLIAYHPPAFISSGFNVKDICEPLTAVAEKTFPVINIYPNPVTDHFTIELPDEDKKVFLEIYNSIGEKIYSGYFPQSEAKVDATFANGVYWIHITSGENNWTKKIVIIR